MNSWKLKNGYEIIQVLDGRANAYLIITGTYNILVDTGRLNSALKIYDNIKGIKKDLTRIDFLILTHTHFDHCENARMLKDSDKCKIVVHKAESGFLQYGYTPIPRGTNILTKFLSFFGTIIGRIGFGYPQVEADILITEDYNFENFDIKILYTPGHSYGSISIIVNDEIAIVGDTIIGLYKNTIYPFYADDQKMLMKSWKLLLDTKCNMFLPGHGTEITRGFFEQQFEKHSKN